MSQLYLIPAEYREILTPQCWPAVEARLRRVPDDLRADALQEAALAHLRGKSPSQAIKRYAERERLYREREIPVSQILPANAEEP